MAAFPPSWLFIFCIYCYLIIVYSHTFFGHIPIPSDERPSFIRDDSQIAENRLNTEDLPDSIDWRNHNNRNYMSWSRNQHIPIWCGSCWAMSATNALAARIMIAHEDIFPQISVSPQLILDCDYKNNYGCAGGDALGAFAWFHEFGAVEDSCNPYVADSWYTNSERTCDKYSQCSYSYSTTDFNDQRLYPQAPRFYVDEFGFTEKGEEAMMKMLTEGPIVCAMAVTDAFYSDYKGGIFIDNTSDVTQTHEVAVIGYGTDPVTDTKFWIAMNSWGTAWGEHGYFRIIRGVNNLAIEAYCQWATVLLDDVDETEQSSITTELDDTKQKVLGGGLLAMKSDALLNNDGIQITPLPEVYLEGIELPVAFTWSDVGGHNLLNVVRQINKPYLCKACWAFAVTDIISQRLNVMEYFTGNVNYLEANLSPQVLINMLKNSDCDGGYAGDAMQYLVDVGVPDETCQNYMAQTDPHQGNEEFNVCYTCSSSKCWTVTPDEMYTVQEYGYVTGMSNMKREIYARGPIACSMFVDKGFQEYTGGVYASRRYCDECKGDKAANYMVSIVGWGYDEDADEEYWIGKNNWGFGWGQNGYFRMKMGINSNYIEDECIWGIPSFEKENEVLLQRMNDLITTNTKQFSLVSWVSRLGPMCIL